MFALASGACHRGGDGGRPPGPLTSALLAFAAEAGGDPAVVAQAWPTLEAIARRVGERMQERRQGSSDATDFVDAMNAVIFGELGFTREIDRDELDVMALPPVMSHRKGSCVGLAALYLAVAERLDVPLEGVLVPGHFFVRVPGPFGRNVELLRRGETMPDRWYTTKYGPWAEQASFYLRGLSVFEVVAVHWFNAGNEAKRAGDLTAAARAYARAAKAFPAFAEATASLGTVRQLQGDLSGARDAYRAAARSRPDLPGLARNLSVLEAEQRLASAAPPAPLRSGRPEAPRFELEQPAPDSGEPNPQHEGRETSPNMR